MVPLLDRIAHELATETDPGRRVALQARQACYLARIGEFKAAKEVVQSLRAQLTGQETVVASTWVMMAEGLIAYFERVGREAYDRLMRANALSTAARDPILSRLTAAWLAHIELARFQYRDMSAHLTQVFKTDESANPDATVRAGIVLGDAYMIVSDLEAAQNWYETARRSAVSCGDAAAIGAIMYNRSAFGLNAIRLATHLGIKIEKSKERMRLVRMETESAIAYYIGTDTKSLGHLLEVTRAQVLVLNGDYEPAIKLYSDVYHRALAMEDHVDKSPLIIDLAWCLLQVGNVNGATHYLALVAPAELNLLDPDDQVICCDKLLDLGRSGLDIRAFGDLQERRTLAVARYQADQAALGQALSGFEASLSS